MSSPPPSRPGMTTKMTETHSTQSGSDSSSGQSTSPKPDHFYVGYLPAPEPYRRFTTLLIAFLVVWFVSLSGVLVLTQRSPGTAVWDNSNEQTWTGRLIPKPYPMLIPDDSDNTTPLLVVAMGKLGAHTQLADAFNHRVTLRGFELTREGRRIIELAPEPGAIAIARPLGEQEIPKVVPAASGFIELVGEITDGKCYLGAMKPGDGFGHRSCAALCIRGGLPPMFVAESDLGSVIYPLFVVDGSTSLNEETIQLVACRVRLRGTLGSIAGIPVLSVKQDDIQPIDLFAAQSP